MKMFFAPPTDAFLTPVQWSLVYSASDIIDPKLAPATAQTLATYQTGGCSAQRPIARYFNSDKPLRRMGI